MHNGEKCYDKKNLQPAVYQVSYDGQSQTENDVLIENQTMCTAHNSFESPASSFSPLRTHSSHSPRRYNNITERAFINYKCQSSFDGSQISSTSPAPSITSGYASTSSDQVLVNSQLNNSKVMATSKLDYE